MVEQLQDPIMTIPEVARISEIVALEGLLARHPEENPLHPDWEKRKDSPIRLRDLAKSEGS